MLQRTVWVTVLCCAVALSLAAQSGNPGVAERVARLSRTTRWARAGAMPIAFNTFHPQGLVKIGATLFLSSVEVHDRASGKGVGHFFKIDASNGKLIADQTLGEGAIYHPGGIDYDGKDIWVPVAEYRPDSRAIIYRVDPQSMKPTEVLRLDDHVGAVVRDVDDGSLHGVSWGSRRFFTWKHDGRAFSTATQTDNPSHYLDYQDCKYVGRHQMACGGVTEFRQAPDAPVFRLGGIDLVDLATGRPLHQSPVPLWTERALDMTHNPLWLEAIPNGLRAYFMPEDERSTLFIYEATER